MEGGPRNTSHSPRRQMHVPNRGDMAGSFVNDPSGGFKSNAKFAVRLTGKNGFCVIALVACCTINKIPRAAHT